MKKTIEFYSVTFLAFYDDLITKAAKLVSADLLKTTPKENFDFWKLPLRKDKNTSVVKKIIGDYAETYWRDHVSYHRRALKAAEVNKFDKYIIHLPEQAHVINSCFEFMGYRVPKRLAKQLTNEQHKAQFLYQRFLEKNFSNFLATKRAELLVYDWGNDCFLDTFREVQPSKVIGSTENLIVQEFSREELDKADETKVKNVKSLEEISSVSKNILSHNGYSLIEGIQDNIKPVILEFYNIVKSDKIYKATKLVVRHKDSLTMLMKGYLYTEDIRNVNLTPISIGDFGAEYIVSFVDYIDTGQLIKDLGIDELSTNAYSLAARITEQFQFYGEKIDSILSHMELFAYSYLQLYKDYNAIIDVKAMSRMLNKDGIYKTLLNKSPENSSDRMLHSMVYRAYLANKEKQRSRTPTGFPFNRVYLVKLEKIEKQWLIKTIQPYRNY